MSRYAHPDVLDNGPANGTLHQLDMQRPEPLCASLYRRDARSAEQLYLPTGAINYGKRNLLEVQRSLHEG